MEIKSISAISLTLILITFIVAAESLDLKKLTLECIKASKNYKNIEKNISYKESESIEYVGYSGSYNNFDLKFPIVMRIRYVGIKKEGYYWFKNNPEKKYKIRAKTDTEGNCEIIEILESGYENYKFRGKIKDGIILGIWEKGSGKKAFAFYAARIK